MSDRKFPASQCSLEIRDSLRFSYSLLDSTSSISFLIGAFALLSFWYPSRAVPTKGEEIATNAHFLLPPSSDENRQNWLDNADEYRKQALRELNLFADNDQVDIYRRNDLKWMSRNFTCAMCMVYDQSFYDSETNRYLIESILEEGRREFGGFNSIVLWHAYPRLGIDERNQFDFYRQLPGGLVELRNLVERCHAQDVRVFIDYNPWDTGTRREDRPDYEVLADLVSAIDADGVFLDTLSEGSQELLSTLERSKSGTALVSEGHPPPKQLAICNGSWAQWLNSPESPGILKLKWIEPRHMQYQIRRWDRSRTDEIKTAFFNGSGMLVWENVFGTYNPWTAQDRLLWKKANLILNFFAERFTSRSSRPYYPSLQSSVCINRWSGDTYDLYVLCNDGEEVIDETLFRISRSPNFEVHDLWNGCAIQPVREEDSLLLRGSIDQLGCVLVKKKVGAGPKLQQLLKEIEECNATVQRRPRSDSCKRAMPVIHPVAVPTTPLANKENPPAGMVYVPGTTKVFTIEHVRGECGCYPDSSAKEQEGHFGYGLDDGAIYPNVIHRMIRHTIGPVRVKPFYIDETEVSNEQYQAFLDQSGYRPKVVENFLKHWHGKQMPEELANYPVTNVDIDDARAYARWCGKRLPTEFEWQLAAQGRGDRKWPWGNKFDSTKCNTTRNSTIKVRSCPEGRSPYGCYHMSGNVWEWTESCRDDGHTRFTMIRGGSYFKAKGSIWYVKGGPQPCGHHAKFIRVWSGLDRSSTIGFRCVKDVEPLDECNSP